MLKPCEPVQCLRSPCGAFLAVSKSRIKSKGDFASTNKAPAESVTLFKSLRKTPFYGLAFMQCFFIVVFVFIFYRLCIDFIILLAFIINCVLLLPRVCLFVFILSSKNFLYAWSLNT